VQIPSPLANSICNFLFYLKHLVRGDSSLFIIYYFSLFKKIFFLYIYQKQTFSPSTKNKNKHFLLKKNAPYYTGDSDTYITNQSDKIIVLKQFFLGILLRQLTSTKIINLYFIILFCSSNIMIRNSYLIN